MNTTLFIEISEITARVLVYNEVDEVCHYVDVTGGYGKKSIPLHIHYLKDGEVLIGEDAIVYDQEDDSKFISSILYASRQNQIDYIRVLLEKVEELIPELKIINLVLVSNKKGFSNDEFRSLINKSLKHISYTLLSVEEAMVGWYHKQNLNSNLTTIYLDYKNLLYFDINRLEEDTLITINSKSINLDLNAINEYYINLLGQLHKDGLNDFTKFQIRQLYNNQKPTLHKQLVTHKDVNVYSSIFFPPRKYVLDYKKFKAFKDTWYEQLIATNGINSIKYLESVDKVVSTGGYDLINFLNSFDEFDFPNYNYDEYLLLDGAYSYYQSMIKGQELIQQHSLDFCIGVFNDKEFYPLIEEDIEFRDKYELELIVSDYQTEIVLFSKVNESVKPVYTVTIDEPRDLSRLILTIKLSNDKEIEEVSYELRRL